MSAPSTKDAPARSAPPVNEAADGLIGAKLRGLRKQRGLTLQAVSDLTGVSVGHLSQLERDLASPAVKTLHDISVALGVNIGWFFDPTGHDVGRQYVVRGANRQRIRFADGIDDYQLNSDAVGELGLLYSVFEPGASSGAEPYTHTGEEAGYIVSGQLDMWIEGRQHALEAGDSFSFPSTCPHRYRNPGPGPTVVIWAMTPPTY